MKTAWSHIGAVLLCLCVSLYGAASDAGTRMGTMEMVICADGGPVTIVVDANGTPVSPSAPCCDCLSCAIPTPMMMVDGFTRSTAPAQFRKLKMLASDTIPSPLYITIPQARGPPSATQQNGLHAMPGCGLVFKDFAA